MQWVKNERKKRTIQFIFIDMEKFHNKKLEKNFSSYDKDSSFPHSQELSIFPRNLQFMVVQLPMNEGSQWDVVPPVVVSDSSKSADDCFIVQTIHSTFSVK